MSYCFSASLYHSTFLLNVKQLLMVSYETEFYKNTKVILYKSVKKTKSFKYWFMKHS